MKVLARFSGVFLLTAILFLQFSAMVYGFTNLPISGLAGVLRGSVALADYDKDGQLDFIVTGVTNASTDAKTVQLWRNTGSGFTNVWIPDFPQVADSSLTWVDYDNDGLMDLMITGRTNNNTSGSIAQLWRNLGGSFSNVTTVVFPGLPGLRYASLAWGDYDNDGRLDLLACGLPATLVSYAQLWRNIGTVFTNVTIPDLMQVGKGSVAWTDFDNDGYLDFLITGTTNDFTAAFSQLWRNTGSGFSNVTASAAIGLPGVAFGSVSFVDYDNDGRQDFMLTGSTNVTFLSLLSQLWHNNGGGFSNITASVLPNVPNVWRSSVAWGDFDNDGRMDFLLTGSTNRVPSSGWISELWKNTGDNFVSYPVAGLPGVLNSSVACGDFNNDGRLDFVVTGAGVDFQGVSQLWQNEISVTNTPPTTPTDLAMTASGNGVLFSWNAAADSQTPFSGLTYNVRAGTTHGANNLLAANVDATTGFRLVPSFGNAISRESLALGGVTNTQIIYWSVQAVDNAFLGGNFAPEVNGVSMPSLRITRGASNNAVISWKPSTWGWKLQESTTGLFGPWSDSSSGELNPSIVAPTNTAKFFRLVSP